MLVKLRIVYTNQIKIVFSPRRFKLQMLFVKQSESMSNKKKFQINQIQPRHSLRVACMVLTDDQLITDYLV